MSSSLIPLATSWFFNLLIFSNSCINNSYVVYFLLYFGAFLASSCSKSKETDEFLKCYYFYYYYLLILINRYLLIAYWIPKVPIMQTITAPSTAIITIITPLSVCDFGSSFFFLLASLVIIFGINTLGF